MSALAFVAHTHDCCMGQSRWPVASRQPPMVDVPRLTSLDVGSSVREESFAAKVL